MDDVLQRRQQLHMVHGSCLNHVALTGFLRSATKNHQREFLADAGDLGLPGCVDIGGDCVEQKVLYMSVETRAWRTHSRTECVPAMDVEMDNDSKERSGIPVTRSKR
jgi:hypothetical protein